jgi:PKD domain
VARRLSSVVPFLLAASLCLFAAPAALAATTPTINFGHDDSLDDPSEPDTGTNDAGDQEVHSGLFAAFNYDATLQPDAQRADSIANANALGATGHPEFVPEDNPTYEKFPFTVPAGDQNGSFTVTVTWEEPLIDFDVYVYRQRSNGTLDPQPVAQAASSADPERATRFEAIAGDPIHAGTYWVYVDNWCSNDHDPLIQRFFDGFCIDEDNPLSNSDEDDFIGQVTFTPFVADNKLPSVSLTGPDSGKTNTDLTFAASGSDPDGTIAGYSFDLDGDGRFEYDNGKNGTVSTRFPNAGVYNVGVRAADDRGGVAYASKQVTISGPSSGTTGKGPTLVKSFKLNRPVFGGRKNAKLVASYKLREAGKATLTLYRGSKKVKRLSTGSRKANKTYKVRIKPKKLKKGATYTVRLSATSADGKRTQKVRLSAKRL